MERSGFAWIAIGSNSLAKIKILARKGLILAHLEASITLLGEAKPDKPKDG
jgi:hypothetical protein